MFNSSCDAMPESSRSTLCLWQVSGLCGNYNGAVSDDRRMPSGGLTQDTNEFIAAWQVQHEGLSCASSTAHYQGICEVVAEYQSYVKVQCALLKQCTSSYVVVPPYFPSATINLHVLWFHNDAFYNVYLLSCVKFFQRPLCDALNLKALARELSRVNVGFYCQFIKISLP